MDTMQNVNNTAGHPAPATDDIRSAAGCSDGNSCSKSSNWIYFVSNRESITPISGLCIRFCIRKF